jgi:hypothetical protein
MKFLEAFGTPGGKTLLIAFLWLTMMLMLFIVRMRGIQIAPEGLTLLSDTSKMLIAILVYSMGGAAPPSTKEEKPKAVSD